MTLSLVLSHLLRTELRQQTMPLLCVCRVDAIKQNMSSCVSFLKHIEAPTITSGENSFGL